MPASHQPTNSRPPVHQKSWEHSESLHLHYACGHPSGKVVRWYLPRPRCTEQCRPFVSTHGLYVVFPGDNFELRSCRALCACANIFRSGSPQCMSRAESCVVTTMSCSTQLPRAVSDKSYGPRAAVHPGERCRLERADLRCATRCQLAASAYQQLYLA